MEEEIAYLREQNEVLKQELEEAKKLCALIPEMRIKAQKSEVEEVRMKEMNHDIGKLQEEIYEYECDREEFKTEKNLLQMDLQELAERNNILFNDLNEKKALLETEEKAQLLLKERFEAEKDKLKEQITL